MKGIHTMELADRLLAKSKGDESGCRLWQRPLTPAGYGEVKWKGKKILAHRAAWLAFKGPIPEGLCVLHKCDVPRCINEDHLFLGTLSDNALDATNKGRMKNVFQNNWRKLRAINCTTL